jgi:TatD DNase family protein
MNFIDVHTHINMLQDAAADIIERARLNHIDRMITIGTGLDDLEKVLQMVGTLKPQVFGTLGFHPHDAKDFSDASEKFLRENLTHPRIVAVGEIGLDYYYDHSPRDVQNHVFRKQMQIAADLGLPVEIHTRDAEEDTLQVLQEFAGRVRGILHCFTGTQTLADGALAIGYNISVSGVVTFKNADALRSVVKSVPLDRLHLETDAPFLTPAPFRGKKNEPAMLLHTAQAVADLKGITLESLARITNENAEKMFSKLKS